MHAATDRRSTSTRSARVAGAVGNAVEWYDFAVMGASAALVAQVLTPGGKGSLTAVFALFGLSFLVRPVGAMLGAAWADRAGRRVPLIATVLAMTLATACIGLLPSWQAAGGVVVLALLGLRIVQGLANGAELVVSVAYLVEHAPPGRRGLWGGAQMATMAAGFAGGMAAVSVVSAVLTPAAMAAWGWRIPFLVAIPLGVVTLLLRTRATETPEFAQIEIARSQAPSSPGRTVLARHLPAVVRGFVLTAALMSSFTLWFVYLPAHLAQTGGVALDVSLASATVGLVVLAASALACGSVSDRWGRRPLIGAGLALLAVTWAAAYPLVTQGVAVLLLAHVAAGAGLGALVLQSTLAESFPLRLRTTGIAVSFGLASALVGGTSTLVADVLQRTDPALVQVYALAWVVLAAGAALTLPHRGGVASQAVTAPGLLPNVYEARR